MFQKKIETNESPAETRTPKEPKLPDFEVRKRDVSVIGPTLRFKGELSANEDLLIEGHIEGTIAHQDKNLTVGRQGRVKADIHARVVDVQGEVEGDIRADEVLRLAKSAKVQGNIQCTRLVMEDGAVFSGSIDMSSHKGAKKQVNLTVADGSAQAGGGAS